MELLLSFLDELERTRIYHRLERIQPEAIMVRVDIPGECWEVEVFCSTCEGVLSDDKARAALERLIKEGDEDVA